MSIVAERPVSAQVADRSGGGRADVVVSAGLAEEIERQEREDNARGYEREPESRVPVVAGAAGDAVVHGAGAGGFADR